MNPVLKGYLQLCRPANLPTAAADILAGMAIVGFFNTPNIPWNGLLLVISSALLYAGGVVLNDVFDYELDKIERPERPIPSGLIQYNNALFFGFFLLSIGILMAYLVNTSSFIVAIFLSGSIIGYDAFSKKFSLLGPLNMGVCRGLNLLLGMSVFQEFDFWPYALVPVLFIFAVTLISRGEIHGKNKKNIAFAGFLYVLVLIFVIVLHKMFGASSLVYLFFLISFSLMVFAPLGKAYIQNKPQNIMKAVKAGVLSIVLLDATLAVAHSGWQIGLIIVLLLPLSILLAKAFAVT